MAWTITKAIPTFPVPDLEAGIAFYKRLGFGVDWVFPEGDSTHAGLMLGSCSMMLSKCDQFERGEAYFIVDDVAACHAALLENEPWSIAAELGMLANREDCPPRSALRPPDAPKEAAYGLRDFSIVDPWGNYMSFGQELPQ